MFAFLFPSLSTTFTISRNSSLVDTPFSLSNLVMASCWTTWQKEFLEGNDLLLAKGGCHRNLLKEGYSSWQLHNCCMSFISAIPSLWSFLVASPIASGGKSPVSPGKGCLVATDEIGNEGVSGMMVQFFG
jgi:hypothetical protein